MDHLIRFQTAEGIDGSHYAASLDEAVSFVEHLRNTEGAKDVRLYRLTEVPLEFRTYYRVEIGASAPAAAPLGEVEEPVMVPEHHPVAPVAAIDMGPMTPAELSESAAANSRRLFSRT